MRQSWRDLLFLHFSAEPARIQRLLPTGLTVDTWGDKAWIGLVPFRMQGIRPLWMPPLPWISAFPETNVRTYVHRDGKEPGVWFFSLDAARWLACRYARARFCLPYFHSRMTVRRQGDRIEYASKRLESGEEAVLRGSCVLGNDLPAAESGSFEFFLVERYLLYAEQRGRLATGRVHHPPYPLQAVEEFGMETTLVGRAGIEPKPFEHALFSAGVDVEVFPLESA